MSRQAPYLQRRGDSFYFRIAVPVNLRHLIGVREITQTLCLSSKVEASPIALEFAAFTKRKFREIRNGMVPIDLDKLKRHLRIESRRMEILELQDAHVEELAKQRIEHLREMKMVSLK